MFNFLSLAGFLGVNRRRWAVPPDDLSGLDGVRRNNRPYYEVKARNPRLLKVGSRVRRRGPSSRYPITTLPYGPVIKL